METGFLTRTIRLSFQSQAVSASAMPECAPMNDTLGLLHDVSMHSDAQTPHASHRALPVVSWVKDAGEMLSFSYILYNCLL